MKVRSPISGMSIWWKSSYYVLPGWRAEWPKESEQNSRAEQWSRKGHTHSVTNFGNCINPSRWTSCLLKASPKGLPFRPCHVMGYIANAWCPGSTFRQENTVNKCWGHTTPSVLCLIHSVKSFMTCNFYFAFPKTTHLNFSLHDYHSKLFMIKLGQFIRKFYHLSTYFYFFYWSEGFHTQVRRKYCNHFYHFYFSPPPFLMSSFEE